MEQNEIVLQVGLGSRSYPIHIGENLLLSQKHLQTFINQYKIMIVTQKVISTAYLTNFIQALQQVTSAEICVHLLPDDGEAHKNLETASRIYDELLTRGFDRKSQLIALGGGVVGDIVGFVAATFLRGIEFIQIPTTLLSQVDSSVGGKTGVNHHLGKNMIGAFYQPQAVIIDHSTLNTLPAREVRAGLAEVVKYGLLGDETFLQWIESQASALLALDPQALSHAIARSCRMKAEIVANDERERGQRALLNLGHTFAHAIEAELGYGVWLHGEAVGLGLYMATILSKELGFLQQEDVYRVGLLLKTLGLPMQLPAAMTEDVFWQHMKHDKKVEQGKLRFIVLKALGQAVIKDDISKTMVNQVIRQCHAPL